MDKAAAGCRSFTKYIVTGGRNVRELVSAETQEVYAQVLAQFSPNEITDDAFQIASAHGSESTTLNFRNLNLAPLDVMLLKCFAIHGLCIVSAKPCVRYLSDIKFLFDYLREEKTNIEARSTSRLSMFTGWLDGQPFSAEKKNSIANSVEHLVSFMQMQTLLRPGVIVFEHRWPVSQKDPVRAPERQVMEQLDLHFFDMTQDIPSDIRCCYITNRLIVNRISETLRMPLKAIEFFQDDIFLVRISA